MPPSVVISPNIKRESVRIDSVGNQIDPKTKQLVKRVDEGYTPSQEERSGLAARPAQEAVKPGQSALGDIIKQEVASQIGSAIVEAVKGLDIKKMVADALGDALK